jgi:hypothetical protein
VVGESIDVEAHQLEIADFAVGALEAGPEVLAVCTVQAAAPLCSATGAWLKVVLTSCV